MSEKGLGILSADPFMEPGEFLAVQGRACPDCRGQRLECSNAILDAKPCTDEVRCLTCGLQFQRVFRLTGWRLPGEPVERDHVDVADDLVQMLAQPVHDNVRIDALVQDYLHLRGPAAPLGP